MYDFALPKSARLAVKLGTPELSVTTIEIEGYTGDTVSIGYSSLPSNQPKTFGNFVAIWEATMIPWGQLPMQRQSIDTNMQNGDVAMGDLTIAATSYIVGYSVTNDQRGICASAVLNAGGLISAPTHVGIAINTLGTDSMSIRYDTLAGYLPKSNKNVIALYPGYASPYGPPKAIATVPIPTDASSGNVTINGVEIGVGLPYTLVYYMASSGANALASAAAVLTFDTDDFQSSS